MAGFPIWLVLELHAPVWELGLATALAYGGGALVSWAGGYLAERYGRKRVAILGNAAIPLLSLSALPSAVPATIALFTLGWWARNLRSPARRAMLTEAVPNEDDRGAAFGFLHGLDIGGAALAGVYILSGYLAGVDLRWLFLATIAPLAISTTCLAVVRTGALPTRGATRQRKAGQATPVPSRQQLAKVPRRLLLSAAALYGFSSYAVAFPVLTVASRNHVTSEGLGAFLVLQAVSSLTGLFAGKRLGTSLRRRFTSLSLAGYLLGALATALLAAGAVSAAGLPALFTGVALLGMALGVIESAEPTLMSVLKDPTEAARGFGALSGMRSAGLLAGNLAVGALYTVSPAWSYGYASILALLAAGAALMGAVRADASQSRPRRSPTPPVPTV